VPLQGTESNNTHAEIEHQKADEDLVLEEIDIDKEELRRSRYLRDENVDKRRRMQKIMTSSLHWRQHAFRGLRNQKQILQVHKGKEDRAGMLVGLNEDCIRWPLYDTCSGMI